jgi:delta 1-pyrroline-5-carboxylate dehydrogenase
VELPPRGAELFRLFDTELDLPPGVLNLVTGAAGTGRALVQDVSTAMVSFTGHRDTGKSIMAVAAGNLTRVALELGGKAPAIVWRDADLDLAVQAIVAARHTNSGQVCTSAERVFVHEELYEPFLQAYVSAVENLSIGHPTEAVDMGPLVSAQQLAKVKVAVETAIDEGAEVITGGAAPAGEFARQGYWFAPTVLRGVRPDMTVMREETFGPVTRCWRCRASRRPSACPMIPATACRRTCSAVITRRSCARRRSSSSARSTSTARSASRFTPTTPVTVSRASAARTGNGACCATRRSRPPTTTTASTAACLTERKGEGAPAFLSC